MEAMGGHKKGTAYLLLDEFTAHMMAKVKMVVYAYDSKINFIIAGYMSKMQVLDVGLNQPFIKDKCPQKFEEFMVTSTTMKPHRQDLAN
jgi:hypothetical protein